LVITSPPYPNAYDYHLYQRFRLYWLGADPVALRQVEIGSHLRGQSDADPRGRYLAEMQRVLEHVIDRLIAGRYAVLVVGDGVYDGHLFHTADELTRVAESIGFISVSPIDRKVHPQRRAIGAGRRLAHEQILLLRKPTSIAHALIEPPAYRLKEYEQDLLIREIRGLASTGRVELLPGGGASIEADAADITRLTRLAIARTIRSETTVATSQWLLEGSPSRQGSRKDSNYLSHGLHRFAGKFYPQLAKAMLNAAGMQVGDLVLDPFGGSGTTAVECSLAGIDSYSIDCSPLATAIARAKVAALAMQPNDLLVAADQVVGNAKAGSGLAALGSNSTRCRAEVESWFAKDVLTKLDALWSAIQDVTELDRRLVLTVLLSDLLREVSHQEPRDLRIRRRASPLEDAPVFELFEDRAHGFVARLRQSQRPHALASAHVIHGDSASDATYRGFDKDGRLATAVVTSPPYASALPYLDTDRLSLVALFGFDPAARRLLERTLIGSREMRSGDASALDELLADSSRLPETTISFLHRYRSAIKEDRAAGFRLRQAPAVLARYFLGIADVLQQVARRTEIGASLFWVVGDSASTVAGSRWLIPTVAETIQIARSAGCSLIESLPISVTRKDVVHSRNAITRNEILHFTRTG
jgi:hypothetical protein